MVFHLGFGLNHHLKNKAKNSNEVKVVVSGVIIAY